MREIKLILQGRHTEARVRFPVMSTAERQSIAAEVAPRAGFADPFALASSHGVALIEAPRDALVGREVLVLDERHVAILRGRRMGVRGLRAFRGLATALLLRTGRPFVTADTILLAAEVALPARLLASVKPIAVSDVQPWVPPWFAAAWARSNESTDHHR